MTFPGTHDGEGERDLATARPLVGTEQGPQPLSLIPEPGDSEALPAVSCEGTAKWNEVAVPLIQSLFEALNRASVRYCHWKSNMRLGETLAGRQDIDLLVDRRQLADVQAIIARCGFKQTIARAGVGHPGVFHAIGLDDRSGRLVDLHVYLGVVSGDSLVKRYRFPVTAYLLDHVTTLAGVRVPRPEAELLMFVVRTALKHVNAVEVFKTNRKYMETLSELAWLRQVADATATEKLLPELFPTLDAALYHRLLDAIADEGALLRRVILGRQVARRLQSYRRTGWVTALISRMWRLFHWLHGKTLKRGSLSLSSGGAIVAVVGPKGTGKSTLSGHIAAQLGRHLAARRIHSGKPPPTALSAIPRLFVPLARRLLPNERLSEYEKEGNRRPIHSMFHVARMYLLAHERSRLLSRAFRAAAGGAIVVSDRYPSMTRGAIDSISFDDATVERTRSPIKRMLMRWERSLYRDMPQPDLAIRLVTPVEVALARDAARNKASGPDASAVLRRWVSETIAEFPLSKVVLLENTGSVDDAVAKAMRIVWAAL